MTTARGFGKATKPAKMIPVKGTLMDRSSLLDTLRKIKESVQNDGSILHSLNHIINGKEVCAIGHISHSRKAVPVSIFHDPIQNKSLYSPLSLEELSSIEGTKFLDKNGDIAMGINAPKLPFCFTPLNTFYLDLTRIDELEEMLPYKEATLDELIYFGMMDESHTPLTYDEMMQDLRMIFHLACDGDWKKLKLYFDMSINEDGDENVCVLTYSDGGEDFYQPQKTRRSWKQNAVSYPVSGFDFSLFR